jgi:hypothetical protein
MENGTDVYGEVHSPLLGSTLDPITMKMLTAKPPQGQGMPSAGNQYRSPLYGCNLTLMRNTLMTMEALSEISGEAKYADHEDEAIRFWLSNCIYPSGVWPVGEHGVWNFYTDSPEPERPHEPGAFLDWEKYWKLAPEAVAKEITLMHTIHCFQREYQGKMLWFHGRHGSSEGHPKQDGSGFARHSGLFARAWAFMYSKTGDPKYLQWAKDQLELLWQLRDPNTGLVPTQIRPPGGPGTGTLPIWAALGFLEAAEWLDEPADRRLFHDRGLEIAMANFRRYYRWDGKYFTYAGDDWYGDTCTPPIAWLFLKTWERAGRPEYMLEHLRVIADHRMKSWHPTESTDAGRYGWVIMFYVQMFNETKDERYLDYAKRLGDYAAANLVLESGLVVGSRYYRYYDRMYHVPKLVQAFLALDHPGHPAVQTLIKQPLF